MEVVTIKVREGTPAAEIHKLIDMAIAVSNTKHIEIIIGRGVTSFNQAMLEQRVLLIRSIKSFNSTSTSYVKVNRFCA